MWFPHSCLSQHYTIPKSSIQLKTLGFELNNQRTSKIFKKIDLGPQTSARKIPVVDPVVQGTKPHPGPVKTSDTRMHSSRMRTVCSSGRLSGGGACSGGSAPGRCLLLGGVCSGGCLFLGRVSAPGGSGPWGGIPACTEADPPPRVDRHTPVKT